MANEASAPPKTQFQLNGTQMLALTLIELQQAQLVAAANACLERSGEKDAADLLAQAAAAIEQAKLKWLQETQRAVRLVSSLSAAPVIGGLKVNGG